MGFTPAEIVEAQYAKDLWVKITLEGEKNYWAKGDLVAAAVKSPMTGPHTLDVIVGLISHHSEIFSLYGHTVKALIAHENLNPAALDQLEILCEKQVAEGKAETGKFQKKRLPLPRRPAMANPARMGRNSASNKKPESGKNKPARD